MLELRGLLQPVLDPLTLGHQGASLGIKGRSSQCRKGLEGCYSAPTRYCARFRVLARILVRFLDFDANFRPNLAIRVWEWEMYVTKTRLP